MARLAEGSETGLKSMCFQAWSTTTEETKHEKNTSAKTMQMQKQLQEMKKKSGAGSKSVLSRLAGSNDTGLIHMTFTAWLDDYKASKKQRDFDEVVTSSNQKFARLRTTQKGKAQNVSERAAELEQINLMMNVFMNWHSEVKMDRLIRHYSGKMENKKHQLEAVRQMFNRFANELGDISNTPRKGNRGHSRVRGEEKKSISNQAAQPAAAPA